MQTPRISETQKIEGERISNGGRSSRVAATPQLALGRLERPEPRADRRLGGHWQLEVAELVDVDPRRAGGQPTSVLCHEIQRDQVGREGIVVATVGRASPAPHAARCEALRSNRATRLRPMW
jgi:hypothetical protein